MLEEAVRRFPSQPLAWVYLGEVRCRRGDWQGAVAPFLTALELDPDQAYVQACLAQAYLWVGRCEEAIEAATRASALNPTLKMAHYLLGNACMVTGRFEKARGPLTRALEAELPAVRASAGEMLAKCMRYTQIEKRLPALLKPEADLAGAQQCYDLAMVLLALDKHHDDCFRLFRRAIELDPSLEEGDRQNASCAALHCGARGQALNWMRESLTLLRERLGAAVGELARGQVAGRIRQLRYDSDLGLVRGEEALAKLSGAEREEWRAYWAEVDALIREAEK